VDMHQNHVAHLCDLAHCSSTSYYTVQYLKDDMQRFFTNLIKSSF